MPGGGAVPGAGMSILTGSLVASETAEKRIKAKNDDSGYRDLSVEMAESSHAGVGG